MSDSVGARLRQGRELRRLSLQQVSEITKLRIHYLQALENDDYSAIPSAAQARGFLRLYAEFLELDLSDLVPPAQPDVAPPTSAPVATTNPAPATPSARPGLWASLRARLGRRAGKDAAAVAAPVAVSEAAVVAPVPVAPAAEPSLVSETPAEAAGPVPASSEVKTKTTPRPKTASADVKKNAGN